MLNVTIENLPQLREQLTQFSQRRLGAAAATALTRTAKAVQQEWAGAIKRQIDRPVPRTVSAVGFASATAQSLEAKVFVKDQAGGGTAPADYLRPQVDGGQRELKKFERSLVASGAMPQGSVTVPGRGAMRDGFGNVSKAQLIAVIRALGEQYSPGYQQTISKSTAKRLASMAKHGRQYVALSPADAARLRVSPGIYEQAGPGALKAIFLFKRAASYARRLTLLQREGIEPILAREVDRAIAESLVRLRERGQT